MPLQATSGAASYDAFGGGVPVVVNYIEDVFSTTLYTGTDAAVTINNGIDLSTKGGMIWWKSRSNVSSNLVQDTARGITKVLRTNTTDAETTETDYVTSLSTTGFSVGASLSVSPRTYATWTFRKQPKFFDIVTYTGDGTNGRAISHSLDSTPGFIIVKSTSDAAQWVCWSRGFNSGNGYGYLNDTTAWFTSGEDVWGNGTSYIAPTSTTFTVKGGSLSNLSGRTYVAYLFAHDAGGFGLTGTDNVISCGSFTGGSPATVNLGYEPQWLLIKSATNADDWYMFDTMRGWTVNFSGLNYLRANTSAAEDIGGSTTGLTSTGFQFNYGSGQTFIYIAIRRGPMKVPTDATKVFAPLTRTGTGATATVTGVGFAPDLAWIKDRAANFSTSWDRLRGATLLLRQTGTSAEETFTDALTGFDAMDGVRLGTDNTAQYINANTASYINWFFKRAPSFFDEVCYTGTGSLRTLTHNLAAVPELIIVKRRSASNSWYVYNSTIGAANVLALNSTIESTADNAAWNSTSPTSTVFTVNTESAVNFSGSTYVAYLFATCAGVSKVGTYTGNGSSQTINCGFTGGARFVLIKRTDSTGDWMVSDSARGIVSGNDPYLELNNTNAEVTGEDWLDTDSTGFVVNEVSGSNANTNGATYIFLAIA